jgi:hypothetical protein
MSQVVFCSTECVLFFLFCLEHDYIKDVYDICLRHDDVTYVYDDVTYVYDDVTYVYDDVTYVILLCLEHDYIGFRNRD